MTDITELTAEKLEEIRQRYRPTLAPKCHICGVEMTIQRMSASRITYGCAGAIYDETGCHYAEGRSLADDHYAESRITVVDVSDPDVLAMVEALEKAQAENTAGVAGMAESYETTISMLRSRIAELESRTVTVKLPEPPGPMSVGARTVYFGIVADVVSAFQYGITAAGIKVEVE